MSSAAYEAQQRRPRASSATHGDMSSPSFLNHRAR